MNRNAQILLAIALTVSIGGKLTVFFIDPGPSELDMPPRFLYFLMIPLLMFISLNNYLRLNPGTTFADHFKKGSRPGVFYTALIGLFTYIYYKLIDPGYFDRMIASRVEEMKANDMTPEQIGQLTESMRNFAFNVNIHSLITLFGYMVFAIICGLILTVVTRQLKNNYG